ncbi:MAG TPA: YidB family protein [Polaromonas sp.]|jgi:uncharacterized protein YidB (DUF937 family)
MGLLDSVLGAVMGGQQPQNGETAAGGLGGLIGLVASNPQLLQAITGMLSNDGAQGGLGGLVAKFQQAGLGEVIGSWVGSGQNQAISGEQLTHVLGSDTLSGLAAKLGVSPDDAAGQLSGLLPGLIDHLTPQGQAPEGGLGNSGELMGMLGGLLQKG